MEADLSACGWSLVRREDLFFSVNINNSNDHFQEVGRQEGKPSRLLVHNVSVAVGHR